MKYVTDAKKQSNLYQEVTIWDKENVVFKTCDYNVQVP